MKQKVDLSVGLFCLFVCVVLLFLWHLFNVRMVVCKCMVAFVNKRKCMGACVIHICIVLYFYDV